MQGTSFHRPAELFLWEIGNDVGRILFLGRLPSIWLGLLLAAIGSRWAGEMALRWQKRTRGSSVAGLREDRQWPLIAAFITLVLLAFDPNILAHTRLATTDLGLAAAAVAAGFTLWRALLKPTPARVVIAGVGLGLLQNTKFTALLFVPLFGIVILFGLWQEVRTSAQKAWPVRTLFLFLILYPLSALITLWGTSGFQSGELASPLPFVGRLGGWPVPLSHHLDQLLDIGGRLQVSTPSFLMGQYSDSGWWFYFPIAFILKTPLPTLILLIGAIILLVSRWHTFSPTKNSGTGFDLLALLIPSVGYFSIALTSQINLGYRHLLPILPFLYVFTGVLFGHVMAEPATNISSSGKKILRIGISLLLGLLIATALWLYPHYLAFFNILAGGPENGWRYLVDSNLDWGQDLANLKTWMDENGAEKVWLSYFGEGRPEYYGIDYQGLDSFPPRLMNPEARSFYRSDPAPGWYAISATNLQGVHFRDHDQFDYFRQREPDAKVGYSIFLYNQPAHGRPIDLLLGNIQVDELSAKDFAILGTNDVRLRWFDGEQALIVPDGQIPIWYVQSTGENLHPSLVQFIDREVVLDATDRSTYEMVRLKPNLPGSGSAETSLSNSTGSIRFMESRLLNHDADGFSLATLWRQDGDPQPVKIFVHLLNDEGDIVAQWDGLGGQWEGWRSGDTLIQIHEVGLKESLPPGTYRLVAGLYDPVTIQRWSSSAGSDVIELGDLTIEEG